MHPFHGQLTDFHFRAVPTEGPIVNLRLIDIFVMEGLESRKFSWKNGIVVPLGLARELHNVLGVDSL